MAGLLVISACALPDLTHRACVAGPTGAVFPMDRKTDEKAGAGQRVPWWRVRMMWLVVGGPLAVVVAAIITAVIAVRGADTIVGSGAESAQAPVEKASEGALRPAIEARNHAAAEAAVAASAGQR